MTFYVAGIHLTSSQGQTWAISPALGDLTTVDAGFSTALGAFASSVTARNGIVSGLTISTPAGTTVGAPFPFGPRPSCTCAGTQLTRFSQGSVSLPGVEGYLVSDPQRGRIALRDGKASGVSGGSWALEVGS
jgi:hypothetical protein